MAIRERFILKNSAGDIVPLYYPHRLSVVAHDGLGMPPVARTFVSGPFQHGASQIHAKLQPRIVTLSIEDAYSVNDSWDDRDTLLRMLNDITNQIYLDVELPDGTTRRLDVRYHAGLTLPLEREPAERYALQFIADDPLLYDPQAVLWAYAVASGAGNWAFDLGFPEGFGQSAVDVIETKNYPGSWLTYPIITIVGPAADLLIENQTTGEKLDFSGHTIQADETVTIDLRYGYKTVESSTNDTDINDLTNDSDIATWHIAAHPEAPDGNNTIHISFTDGTNETQIRFQFYVKYLGI